MTQAQPIEQPRPFISEPLTWEQICERYPDEWVCLVEIDEINDTDFDFRTARVVGHGKTRRVPLDQARPWLEQYDSFARIHTGDCNSCAPSPDQELVLLSPNLDGRIALDHMPQDDVMTQAPPDGESLISEPLTWEQICERYPSEWVCLVEMDKINDTDFDFRTARVVGHGKTRRAPLEQSRSFRETAGYHEAGHYFTRRPER